MSVFGIHKVGVRKRPFPVSPQKAPAKRILLQWQSEAIKLIALHKRTTLTAPTGSGKTEIIKCAAWARVNAPVPKKVLIVVPQTQIAKGLLNLDVQDLDGSHYSYASLKYKNQIFYGDGSRSTTSSLSDSLVSWIHADVSKVGIAITTVSTLVAAYKKMVNQGLKPEMFSDLFVIQDEAHHISYASAEGDPEVSPEEATQLGIFYGYLLRKTNADLLMVSATPYRGDNVPLFLENAREMFDGEYVRLFEDHWKWLEIENFYHNFISFEEDPEQKLIEVLKAEGDQRHIILLPADGRSFRRVSTWVPDFVQTLTEIGIPRDQILDMVTSKGEELDLLKTRIAEDSEHYSQGGESKIRIILSVNIMREGADWVPATRIHELAPSKSTTRTTQSVGRLFRKDFFNRKIDVAYYPYFENLKEHASEEETRHYVTDRTNLCWAGLLVVDQMFSPTYEDWAGEGGDSQKNKLNLNEAKEHFFGDSLPNVEEVLLLTIQTILGGENRHLTPRETELAIQEASRVSPGGDLFAKRKVLAKLIQKYEDFAHNSVAHPKIKLEFSGHDQSEIRARGFNHTEFLSQGLFVSETMSNTNRLTDLRKVLNHIQTSNTNQILVARLTQEKSKSTRRQLRALKTKAKRNPEALSLKERLHLDGRGNEQTAIGSKTNVSE